MLVCSGSKDTFKIWDISVSKDYPIFNFDTSKKWVYDCVFDPSILSLMINIEGKYFSHNIFSLTQDRIVEKKFNLFDENTTSTACHPNNPTIYISSIHGIIYGINKMSIMNMEKLETPDSKGKSK
jgi:WD40 repeat protein